MRARSPWRYWVGWTAASGAGVLLSSLASGLPPVMGLLVGAGQWLVLRRWWRGAGRWGWWVPATAAGATAGWLAALALQVPLLAFGPVLGLGVALAQAPVLLGRGASPRRTAVWVPAGVMAWGVGHTALTGIQWTLYARRAEAFFAGQPAAVGVNTPYFLSLAAMGLVTGAITGAVLVWLRPVHAP